MLGGQVMRPRATLHLVTPEQGVHEVVQLLARYNINQVLVVQQRCLVGMVSREAIVNYLEVRQSLGLAGEQQGEAGSPQRETRASLPAYSVADQDHLEGENGDREELLSKP